MRSGAASLDTWHDGGHVCWVVHDPGTYRSIATSVLATGAANGRKPVVFGPSGSADAASLAPLASLAADPYSAFLGGGPLNPNRMFGIFREQSVMARDEGFTGLCVVADMDWLLPVVPRTDEIVRFEVQLDRVVRELDATVFCAYRPHSFEPETLRGALCVHPVGHGKHEPPPFRLFAIDDRRWSLSGEVDLLGNPMFLSALEEVTPPGGECTVHVGGLDFIDVAGMRCLARASADRRCRVHLTGTSAHLRRVWQIGGFDLAAPDVHLHP